MHAPKSAHGSASAARVSTLELFFDLVFVFTITQVSDLIFHAHGLAEVALALLVLALVWWMYGGYAWLTNNVGTAQLLNRFLVLLAMIGFLVMALSVPQAFGRDGLAFGLAYLLVNVIHAVLFTRAPSQSSARAIWRVAPFNIGSALLVLLASQIGEEWGWTLWCGAALLLVGVPLFAKIGGFAVEPAHFVERHGLVLIIAFGESIISIGVGAAEEAVTLELAAAAALMLALIAALWWSYFAQDEQRAEHALVHADSARRAYMALYGFGYAYLVMIGGVVLTAAGIKQMIAQLHGATHDTTAALLGAGIAIYLLGDTLFRRALRISPSWLRLAVALLSLATIPLGVWAGGMAQVGALLALLVLMLVWEARAARRAAPARRRAA